MRVLGVSVLIGAALSGAFRSTIGSALSGIGEMDKGLGGLQRRVLDVGQAWAGLAGLKHVVSAAGDQEHELAQIGIIAGMSAGQVEELRKTLRNLSAADVTNQSTSDLIKAYKTLASSGLTDRITETKDMEAIMRAVGRTATAATSDIDDVAKMAFTLVDTLSIAPDDLSKELDRLAYAGNKGAFELRDMARYFPVLGAAAKEAGLTGSNGVASLGAALQFARKGAGESSEAANNMRNFFQKMMSPETIKNMAAHGVNVTKLMADALKKGEDPIQKYLERLDKMLGNDPTQRKGRLGALFQDAQVQDFIRPMIANLANYKQMKAEILQASGTVDQQYATIMATFKEQAKGAGAALDNLGTSIGRSLLPPLGAAIAFITPVIGGLADITDKAPGTTMAITGVGAALIILPPALRLVAFGIRGIGAAMKANPIGIAISAIAIGAGLIYDHWEPIGQFFTTIWDGPTKKWKQFTALVGDGWATIAEPINKALAFMGLGGGLAAATAKTGQGGAGAAASAAAATKGQIDVNVNLDGLPRGSDVSTQTKGSGIGDVDMYAGYQMAMP